MSWFKRIATGLGTEIGAMVETAAIVIDEVKRGYESYKARGGMTGSAAKAEPTTGTRGRRSSGSPRPTADRARTPPRSDPLPRQ